jgi:hypothetical protein
VLVTVVATVVLVTVVAMVVFVLVRVLVVIVVVVIDGDVVVRHRLLPLPAVRAPMMADIAREHRRAIRSCEPRAAAAGRVA